MFTASTHTKAQTCTYCCNARLKNAIIDLRQDKALQRPTLGFTTHTDVLDCPELTKPLNHPPQSKVVKLLILAEMASSVLAGLPPGHKVHASLAKRSAAALAWLLYVVKK